jgi:hypothetical protein
MSGNETGYAHFLFSFGPIHVYELKPKAYDIFNASLYYWRQDGKAEYNGPFKTIMECTRHWEYTSKGELPTAAPAVVDMTNVIRVDFKAKKRIK